MAVRRIGHRATVVVARWSIERRVGRCRIDDESALVPHEKGPFVAGVRWRWRSLLELRRARSRAIDDGIKYLRPELSPAAPSEAPQTGTAPRLSSGGRVGHRRLE